MLARLTSASTTDSAGGQTASYGYGYDGNGNLSLAYNAANQTTAVTPAGGSALSLTYAGNDQAERTKAGSTSYTNAITGVGSETSSASTYYTRDNKGALLSERTPSGKYYYLFDGVGSVVALTDSSGSVVASYKYDPFGKQTASTGTVANPWRFAGQCLDIDVIPEEVPRRRAAEVHKMVIALRELNRFRPSAGPGATATSEAAQPARACIGRSRGMASP